jgi:DNA transposition AAA+ family ATPase
MTTKDDNTYTGDPTLRTEVRATMAGDKRLSQAATAKEAGISPAAFNQWLNANYKGDNEALDAKVRIWLESYHARLAAGDGLPEAPAFVATPTASRVISALGYAQVAGDIVVSYGAAGLGKTTACRRYQTSRPNVWIATMTPASSGVVTSLEDICEALDVTEGGGARRMFRAIVKRVRDTHGLLVIDEAQHLSVAALDQIRSIHDATGVGIALVGNEGVYARMAGGRNAAQLDRLFSRIGRRLSLRRSTDADIQALVKAWGIEDKKCLPTIMDIARRPGALRTLTKTLRLAAMQAAAESRAICCQDVRAAARELGGAA